MVRPEKASGKQQASNFGAAPLSVNKPLVVADVSPPLLVIASQRTPELAILPDRDPLSRLRKGLLVLWVMQPFAARHGHDSSFDQDEGVAVAGRGATEVRGRHAVGLVPGLAEFSVELVQPPAEEASDGEEDEDEDEDEVEMQDGEQDA